MSLIADWLSRRSQQARRSPGLVLENEIVRSLLRQRATSPSTAVAVRDSSSAPGFQEIVDSGMVREAAPGTFYVYQRALERRPAQVPGPLPGRKVVLAIVFWLLVILIPLAFIQFFP